MIIVFMFLCSLFISAIVMSYESEPKSLQEIKPPTKRERFKEVWELLDNDPDDFDEFWKEYERMTAGITEVKSKDHIYSFNPPLKMTEIDSFGYCWLAIDEDNFCVKRDNFDQELGEYMDFLWDEYALYEGKLSPKAIQLKEALIAQCQRKEAGK